MQNELAILEFIHCLVETLDRYFSNVCELDLMFSLEQVCTKPSHPGMMAGPLPLLTHLWDGSWQCTELRQDLGPQSEGGACVAMQAHFIVDEMLMNGAIVETNKQNILAPIQLLEKAA